jgi:hypothetical protein
MFVPLSAFTHYYLAHHQERTVEAVLDVPPLHFLPGLGPYAEGYSRWPPVE